MAKALKQKSRIMSQFLDLLKTRTPKVGSVVVGTVIAKEPKRVFIDLGAIGTGLIYGTEYIAARDQIRNLSVGEQVSVKILSIANEEGFFEVSLKEAVKEEAWQTLKRYRDEKTILSLPVLEANRGGLIMELCGITGFLPVSQLSLEHYPRVEGGDKNKILSELSKLVGKSLRVRVIDVSPQDGKLIFSEREAGEEKLKEALSKYKVGDIVEGVITAVVNFGAFMKFGELPLEGLIHISE
ncbi:MAG: S1 RNA-binding domain-containing protein, partial [Candidatus Paceibacteria bacterium]